MGNRLNIPVPPKSDDDEVTKQVKRADDWKSVRYFGGLLGKSDSKNLRY